MTRILGYVAVWAAAAAGGAVYAARGTGSWWRAAVAGLLSPLLPVVAAIVRLRADIRKRRDRTRVTVQDDEGAGVPVREG